MIQNKQELEKQLDIIVNKLEKFGYKLGRRIGDSKESIVFTTYSDRVIKITIDKNGAEVVSKWADKKFKHIVRVFRVFRFKTIENVYFVVEEKLKPLSAQENKIISYLNINTEQLKKIKKWAKKYNNFKTLNDIEKVIQKYKLSEAVQNFLDKQQHVLQKFNPNTITYLMDRFTIFRFEAVKQVYFQNLSIIQKALSVLEEMIKQGIAFENIKSFNFMKNQKGTYKWVNLGYTEASNKKYT